MLTLQKGHLHRDCTFLKRKQKQRNDGGSNKVSQKQEHESNQGSSDGKMEVVLIANDSQVNVSQYS